MIERIQPYSGWLAWSILVLGMSASLYFGNAPHTAVEVPVQDGALIQRLQSERDQYRKERDDYKALAKNLAVQVKSRNFVIAQYEQQLKALAVSVPPQPVILEAVRREAVTEKGFRQVVARNFGEGIAKRVRVIE